MSYHLNINYEPLDIFVLPVDQPLYLLCCPGTSSKILTQFCKQRKLIITTRNEELIQIGSVDWGGMALYVCMTLSLSSLPAFANVSALLFLWHPGTRNYNFTEIHPKLNVVFKINVLIIICELLCSPGGCCHIMTKTCAKPSKYIISKEYNNTETPCLPGTCRHSIYVIHCLFFTFYLIHNPLPTMSCDNSLLWAPGDVNRLRLTQYSPSPLAHTITQYTYTFPIYPTIRCLVLNRLSILCSPGNCKQFPRQVMTFIHISKTVKTTSVLCNPGTSANFVFCTPSTLHAIIVYNQFNG